MRIISKELPGFCRSVDVNDVLNRVISDRGAPLAISLVYVIIYFNCTAY